MLLNLLIKNCLTVSLTASNNSLSPSSSKIKCSKIVPAKPPKNAVIIKNSTLGVLTATGKIKNVMTSPASMACRQADTEQINHRQSLHQYQHRHKWQTSLQPRASNCPAHYIRSQTRQTPRKLKRPANAGFYLVKNLNYFAFSCCISNTD